MWLNTCDSTDYVLDFESIVPYKVFIQGLTEEKKNLISVFSKSKWQLLVMVQDCFEYTAFIPVPGLLLETECFKRTF